MLFIHVRSSLTLMMQTGAFLHFILALTAIVSRLSYLVAELMNGLDIWKAALQALLPVLNVRSFFAVIPA